MQMPATKKFFIRSSDGSALKNKITDAIKKPVEIAYVTLNTIAFAVGKRPNASPQTAVKTINDHLPQGLLIDLNLLLR